MKKLLYLLLVFAAILPLAAAKKGNPNSSAKDKARYYFLQGAVAEAEGNPDQAYEFYKKAWLADPSYNEGAYNYGVMRFTIDIDTLASAEEKLASLKFAKALVEKYPADYYTALNYAYLAGMVDSISEPIRVFRRLVELRPDKTAALLYLSQFYAIDHKTDKAVEALSQYERIEGSNIPITLRKVVYRLSDGDTIAAVAEADRLISQNPADPQYIMLKGNVYEYIEMPDSALYYYKLAEAAAPENGTVAQQLAKFYGAQGDSVNYDLMTYRSLMSEDLDLEEKLEQMAAYLQKIINDKSDTQRGDNLFNVLRNQYPHESEILYLSARYNAAKGKYKQAIEDVGYAIDLDGDNEDLWQSLMMFQLSNETPIDAMATYRRMKKRIAEPKYGTDLLFANAAVQADSTQVAIDLYQSFLKTAHPSLSISDTLTDKSLFRDFSMEQADLVSDIYEMAGDAFYAAKPRCLSEAYTAYENSLFFNPDNLLTLNNYAYFIIEEENPAPDSERFQRAKEMSRKTIDRTSSDPNGTYYDTYAWILFKEGNYKEARQYQQAAVETEEKAGTITADLYSHYGDILFMSGSPDEALLYWEKALKLTPDNDLLKKKVKNKTFYWK
ncbi:MAG: tetratricopeptide repeat protein [Clostridium sp.]|nr:tetratricopeptide repeat protein [Prevotella sp.]MCM1429558.1 tetratricopeptide repeat protein [Clostridium sp.]MCM1476035.1 tetratricopeptide repeat protein [Muribaculaceae bacterium]